MALYREQTARRDYGCERGCGEPIRAGERYVRAALPPVDGPERVPPVVDDPPARP